MRENTTGSTVGTKVINARVSPSPSANLVEPVEMLFEKINVREKINQNIFDLIFYSFV